MPKPAPKADAPVADHKKHAEEILEDPKFKEKPVGYKPTDEVKDK